MSTLVLRRGRNLRLRLGICLAVLALVGIYLTKDLGYRDNNDFQRIIEFMLSKPSDAATYEAFGRWFARWDFATTPSSPLSSTPPSTAALQFWLDGLAQKPFFNHFDLRAAGVLPKALLVALALWAAHALRKHNAVGAAPAMVGGALLYLVSFSQHNISFLNSFYQERSFVVFLPLLVVGMLLPDGTARRLSIFGALLMLSGAKAQYFYFPTLFALAYGYFCLTTKTKPDKHLLAGALAAQLLAASVLTSNPFKAINYYHSLYLGSYLLLDGTAAAGIIEHPECIGVDTWGNKFRKGTEDVQIHQRPCFGRVQTTFRDVVAPYLAHPGLLYEIWTWPLESHATVRYYHIFRGMPYAVPPRDAGPELPRNLFTLATDLRERFVSPTFRFGPAILAGLFLALPWTVRRRPNLQMAIVLLSLVSVTQVFACFLGEGVRDLNKHLAAAQLCYDVALVLLTVFLLAALADGWRGRRLIANGNVKPGAA